jgi:protein subunit release factor B
MAIMPSARIPDSDEKLLAECDVETFRASGPGGQNVNKRSTAVRLRHRPSGLVVTCQQQRTQHRNKQLALARLRRKLEALYRRRHPRVPTVMPRAVRNRILDAKKRTAQKKRLRRPPTSED